MLQHAIDPGDRHILIRGSLLASAALTASLSASAGIVAPAESGSAVAITSAQVLPVASVVVPAAEGPPNDGSRVKTPVHTIADPAGSRRTDPVRPVRLSFSSRPLVSPGVIRFALPPVRLIEDEQKVAVTRTSTGETAEASGRAPTSDLSSDAYIDQVATPAATGVRIAQLSQAVGNFAEGSGETVSAEIAAMQIPPPTELTPDARAQYLALAPEQLTLRIGETAAGKVAVTMGDDATMAVQLAGLIDALSDRLGPTQFERLRESSAADTFVTLAQLRSEGIPLRYDAAYDELRLEG